MNESKKPNVITPIVHMNGTSRDELLWLRERAYRAVHEAEKALMQMSPNGRDYYPEPGRMEKALDQHDRRMKALAGLMDELVAEAEILQDDER